MIAGTSQFFIFYFFFDPMDSTFQDWLIGSFSIVFSATMILGFLTPVAGALFFIAGILFLFTTPRGINTFFVIYPIILSLVIVLLGPGAYSVDARLFGRREIILSKKN